MYISFRKAMESWTIGYTHRDEMNPDPFQYLFHRNRRVGHSKAVEIATGLRGEVSYRKAQRILKNHDLEIGRKEFYNLQRSEALKKLSQQDELKLLLSILNEEDFRVRVQDEYTLDNAGMNFIDEDN